MPPPLALDGALPSRRSQRSTILTPAVTASPNTRSRASAYADEFRQERLERARQNSSSPPPRAVPVSLSGETQEQYNHQFEQWLAGTSESLEAMREDPKRERKLWLAFASQTHKVGEIATSRGQKRNLDGEYDALYQRSASFERKRLRQRDASVESDKGPARGFDERETRTSTTLRRHGEEFSRTSRSRSRTHSSESRGEDQHYHRHEMPPRSRTSPRHRSPSSLHHFSRDRSDQPLQPRSRAEILTSRVLSAEDYMREIKEPKSRGARRQPDGKLAKIPKPLFAGETEHDYEQAFGRWLHHRQTSELSLRHQPLKERVYRYHFARQRVEAKPRFDHPLCDRHTQSPLSKSRSHHFETQELPRALHHDGGHGQRDNKTENLPRKSSRSTSFSSSEPTVHSVDINHTTHDPTCGISRANWDTHHRNPKEESGHNDTGSSMPAISPSPQKSVHTDTTNIPTRAPQQAPKTHQAKKNIASEDLTTHLLRTPDGEEDASTSQDTPPKWALYLIRRVQELESAVTQLQREVETYRVKDGVQHCSSCDHDNVSGGALKQKVLASTRAPGTANSSSKKDDNIQVLDLNIHDLLGNENNCDADTPLSTTKYGTQSKADAAKIPQPNEEIYREATLNLAHAAQLRVKEDSKKRQVTEEYDHLNEQIMMNETAINDARDYVKAIKDVDEAMAIEQHSQIMELVVSINQEKEKRASALAALIMFTWTGNKDTLLSVLNEKPSAARKNEASHEKLGAISCRIEQKNNELETLKMHLNEQLEWVRDIPSSVSESGKALRFKALRKLSRRLTKEQTARKQLQKEREDILMCFLQDEETRKLVKKLL